MSAVPPASSGPRPAPAFFSARVSVARRFYLDLNPPHAKALTVVCGGCEHCTPDYAIHRLSFPYYSIEYVVRGRGWVKLAGRRHQLRPGRLFSYGPGVRHDITADPDDPPVKYFVDFVGRAAKRLLASCGLAPGTVAQTFPPHELEGLFNELIQAGNQAGRHGDALCGKLVESLALKIADARAPLAGAETLAFRTYQECRQHIQTHFLRLRTLREIASECRVSHAYVCRLFRRYDSQSPYQYLLRLKMNHAAELLQDPRALVKQVGEVAGFSDPFHFSRAFKSVLGLSPDRFRRLR